MARTPRRTNYGVVPINNHQWSPTSFITNDSQVFSRLVFPMLLVAITIIINMNHWSSPIFPMVFPISDGFFPMVFPMLSSHSSDFHGFHHHFIHGFPMVFPISHGCSSMFSPMAPGAAPWAGIRSNCQMPCCPWPRRLRTGGRGGASAGLGPGPWKLWKLRQLRLRELPWALSCNLT